MTEAGCWEWQGFRSRGYGYTSYRGKSWPTHRLMFRLVSGPIPSGRYVCHHCDNRPCCNPAHLWLGDAKANSLDVTAKGRHYQTAKTHCPKGHEYTPENTYVGSLGRRNCRACQRLRNRRGILRPGTAKALKTHCQRGHALTEDNLYVAPNGNRQCRICHKQRREENAARMNLAYQHRVSD